MGAVALAERLRVEPREVSAVLETLAALDWVGRLSEEGGAQTARYVLLADPAQTWVGPLAERLLVGRVSAADPIWMATGLHQLKLRPLLSLR
jgi:membrane protein